MLKKSCGAIRDITRVGISKGTRCHDGRHEYAWAPAVLCGCGGEKLSGYIDVLV